jgi:hypothetical protein
LRNVLISVILHVAGVVLKACGLAHFVILAQTARWFGYAPMSLLIRGK